MVTTDKIDVKTTPFKIADDQIPVVSLIEQNNFTNESLHIIGQQLDRIEEKIAEKTVSVEKSASVQKPVSIKTKEPLINLPSHDNKFKFKTSQSKTLEIVKKCLLISRLKLRVLLQVLLLWMCQP